MTLFQSSVKWLSYPENTQVRFSSHSQTKKQRKNDCDNLSLLYIPYHFTGHAANVQFGPVRDTSDPSAQMVTSGVHSSRLGVGPWESEVNESVERIC